MPGPATPNARRRKVRCPKCTAFFSEPAKATFECPICSCRLSANGAVALSDSLINQAKEREFKSCIVGYEGSRIQSQEGCFRDGSDTRQDMHTESCEENRGTLPTQMCKEEQQPIAQNEELPGVPVPDNDGKEEKPSGDGTIEDLYGNKNSAVKDNLLEESNLAVPKNGVIEEDECVEKSGAINKRLQLQMFRAARCEFSFKYSLEGALPLESDSYKKRLPSKFSSSEKKMPNTEASDVPLYTPLRVRISNTQEESSDQSEHGRYSFGSDTDSHDGSESEFDFPAPWADGLQDKVPPDSFGRNELFQHRPKQAVSATPHQLELQDVYDATTNEEDVLHESNKRSVAELPFQMGDAVQATSCIGRDDEFKDDIETSSSDHSSQVTDLANLVSSVTLNPNQNLVENGSTHESSDERGFDCERVEEAVSICHDANLESSADINREKLNMVLEGRQVLQLIGEYNGTQEYMNAKNLNLLKDSESLPSSNSYNIFTSSATAISSNQQDPQFASSRHTISCVDGAQSDSHIGQSRGGFQDIDLEGICEKENFHKEMMLSEISKDIPSTVLEGHLANLEKVICASAEPDARDKNVSDHNLLQDTEMELDLYRHHKVDEWQYAKEGEKPTPSKAHYYTSVVQNQSHHLDLQQTEAHPSFFSDYSPNVALANTQPYVLTNHDYFSLGASSSSQMYTYQVPSQPLMLPATFHNHAMAPFGYHTVSNACMLCSLHQHPHMQNHFVPHCAVCQSHSGSIACNSGHADHWSSHQAHHGPAPAFATCTQGPINVSQSYDFPITDLRLQAFSSGKVSQYPPLPKDGAAPYFTCKGCSRVLQVPLDLPPNNGIIQKLRCSACGRVTKFSDKHHTKQRVVSSSPSFELNSLGGGANIQPLVQYNTHTTNSSHDHNVLTPMSPWTHEGSSSKVLVQVDTGSFPSRVTDLSSQGGDYSRGKPGVCAFDGSINTGPSYMENASSVTGVRGRVDKVLRSTGSTGFERTRQDAAPSSHVVVDEKDEGLDFGAPRISDGDSLDQSESRMRSPENVQAQRTCAGVPEGVPLGGCQAPGQVSELDWGEEDELENQEKKPGSPLLVLLNQESTRFRLTLDPRVPPEVFESPSWSPASDSRLTDNRTQNRRREHFVSKGPRYIAGLLRRSLRDLSKGGQ